MDFQLAEMVFMRLSSFSDQTLRFAKLDERVHRTLHRRGLRPEHPGRGARHAEYLERHHG
jgi:hypothetical protein